MDKMESIIKNISKDIEELDTKISDNTKIINDLRNNIISDIKSKSHELSEIISKNSIENKINADLKGQITKLKLEIDKYDTKVKYIKTIKDDINSLEKTRLELQNSIKNIIIDKDNISSSIEIIKIDEKQQINNNKTLKEEEKELSISISRLNDTISKLNLSIIDLRNKESTLIQNNKILETNISVKSNEYNLLTKKYEKTNKEKNDIENIISVKNMEIGQLNEKNNSILAEIKKHKTDIKEMNEIKDNIKHIIDNEKKKSRSDENKILAIKKEVLNLIVEYKDIGNKKRMSELAKDVKNV